MTKKKRSSKRPKKASPESTPRKPAKLSWLPTKYLSSLLAIASFVISLVVFWPRLSVDRDEILDPRKPFSSTFLVKNDGYGFCYPVHYSVTYNKIVTLGGGQIKNIGIDGFGEDIPKLCPNKSSTISIERFLVVPPNSIKSADMNIDIQYKPSWMPSFFNRFFQDSFKFKVARKENGDYVWQKYY